MWYLAENGRRLPRFEYFLIDAVCRLDIAAGGTGLTVSCETACPFAALYWDFPMRHEQRFARHRRTATQWRNLGRLDATRRTAIRWQTKRLIATLD